MSQNETIRAREIAAAEKYLRAREARMEGLRKQFSTGRGRQARIVQPR